MFELTVSDVPGLVPVHTYTPLSSRLIVDSIKSRGDEAGVTGLTLPSGSVHLYRSLLVLVESRVHVSVVLFPSVMSNRLVSGVMEGGLNTVELKEYN